MFCTFEKVYEGMQISSQNDLEYIDKIDSDVNDQIFHCANL